MQILNAPCIGTHAIRTRTVHLLPQNTAIYLNVVHKSPISVPSKNDFTGITLLSSWLGLWGFNLQILIALCIGTHAIRTRTVHLLPQNTAIHLNVVHKSPIFTYFGTIKK